MPSTVNTEIPAFSRSAERFDTVRDVYDALYRGELDEEQVADLLLVINRRLASPFHAFSGSSRREAKKHRS